MEKRKRKEITVPQKPKQWGLKEVLRDLELRGAKEITPEMRKQEPYKSLMKGIRRNGKFVCE